MIGNDDEWICDLCTEPNGEFNTETGNHVMCEEMRDLRALCDELAVALKRLHFISITHPHLWQAGCSDAITNYCAYIAAQAQEPQR